MLGLEDRWCDDRVEVAADWSAGAYGVADVTTEKAIRLAARYEALARVAGRRERVRALRHGAAAQPGRGGVSSTA